MTDWSGWAGQLLSCNEDTTTTTGSVVCYLQNSIGMLNTLTGRDYYILDESITGTYPFSNLESGIVAQMWICESYRRLAKRNLGAAGVQVTLIQDKDGGTMRIASKTDAAKVAASMNKDCMEVLDNLIGWYKKRYKVLPRQTLYRNKIPVPTLDDYLNGCCPPDCYTYNNPWLNVNYVPE